MLKVRECFAVDPHSENTTNHIQDTGLTTYTALEYIVLREASTSTQRKGLS